MINLFAYAKNDYLNNYFSEIPIYLAQEDPALSKYGAALYGLVDSTEQTTQETSTQTE